MLDAAQARACRVRGRWHRDHLATVPGAGAREGNHRRRLSHPLARGIPRQGWHARVITARAAAPMPGPNTCNAGVPLRRPPTYIGAEPNTCALALALPSDGSSEGPWLNV